jgi:PhzF family phenazine biosynthesis protein
MKRFAFQQVDVFSAIPLKGNPLAVVLGADGLSDPEMATFANWTNLSETTFLSAPAHPDADYKVRIFTPARELPFAGHPTLGSCHVWLAAGGKPKSNVIIQECGVGLVRIRRDGARLAFAAPPLLQSGPIAPAMIDQIARGLGIDRAAIRDAQWADNGPGWMAVLLSSRAEVLALKPDPVEMGQLKLGVVAPWDPAVDGTEAQFEVRALYPGIANGEDPVTGSLNAALAQWLIGAGIAPASYVAAQGTVLGRAGRVFVDKIGEDVWIGGHSTTCVEGFVKF